jgi:hypothetical protein
MTRASTGRDSLAIVVALMAWFGLILQCVLSLQLSLATGKRLGSGLLIFFSFFTVLTNLLVSISLSVSLGAPASAPGKWFSRASVQGGVAASIAFVSLSYHLLLRHVWNPQGAQLLADVLLHYAVPFAYVVYWWLQSPHSTAPRWTDPAWWSLYPTTYFVYALIRGKLVGNYPYPFIDAGNLGYATTVLNGCGLLFVFYALGLAFVAVDRWRRRRRA